MDRQPQPSAPPSETSAAQAPPKGIAAMITVTTLTRCSARVDSEANEMKFGMAPPNPRPVSKRAANKDLGPTDCEVRMENNPKSNSDTMRAFLRPI